MGLKGGSCDGGIRSYQVPSKRQGTHVSGDMGMHGDAWGCMVQNHQYPWDMHTLLAMKHHATPAIMNGDPSLQ